MHFIDDERKFKTLKGLAQSYPEDSKKTWGIPNSRLLPQSHAEYKVLWMQRRNLDVPFMYFNWAG